MFLKKLKNQKGEANSLAIMFVIISTFVLALYIFVNSISNEMYTTTSKKYMQAFEIASKAGFYNIDFEITNDGSGNYYNAEELIALGLAVPTSSTELESGDSARYTIMNLRIDTAQFTKDFYNVVFENMGITDEDDKIAFKGYIPIKAILENDRLLISGPNDIWGSYPLTKKIGSTLYYFTLDNQVYTVVDSGYYANVRDRAYLDNLGIKDLGLNSSEDIRNMVTEIVENIVNNFLNITNTTGSYVSANLFNLSEDERDTFFSNVNGIGFFCFINGAPIKTITQNRTLTSLYTLDFGSSGLTRKDVSSKKSYTTIYDEKTNTPVSR